MSELWRNLSAELQKQIEDYAPEVELKDVGSVLEAGDGIARISGLTDISSQELIQFENGVMGIAFNLERDDIGGSNGGGERTGQIGRDITRCYSITIGQDRLSRQWTGHAHCRCYLGRSAWPDGVGQLPLEQVTGSGDSARRRRLKAH